MMNLRRMALVSLIASEVATWPLPLHSQQSAIPVIGFLTTASEATRGGDQLTAFRAGLQQAGFTEGKNLRVEYRWANDNYDQLRVLAAELVGLRVAVIVTAGGPVSALVAHDATKKIPIVFATVADPVKAGLVTSLNKPGGNATGTAGLTSELDPKRLEFLHAVKPSATLIGVLVNPSRPGVDSQLRELEEAGNKMGLKLEIQNAGSDQEINNAFQAFASTRAGAVLVTADSLFNNHLTQVLSLSASYSLPAIYQWREFTAAGGLMSYGPSITSAYYHAGVDAGLILKGTKPTDIPVVQPERFELIINKKTAETLSLHIPETLLAAANEVIE